MTNDEANAARKQLEEILGFGPINVSRNIPGLVDVSGREFIYISCAPNLSVKMLGRLFDQVLDSSSHIPQYGGALSENCTLTLSSGECFFGLSYKGDVKGWRSKAELGARVLGLKIAEIVRGDTLLIEDGREIRVADCIARFF